MSPVGRKLQALVPFPTNGPRLCPTPMLHALPSARVPRQHPGHMPHRARCLQRSASGHPMREEDTAAGALGCDAPSNAALHAHPRWTRSRPGGRGREACLDARALDHAHPSLATDATWLVKPVRSLVELWLCTSPRQATGAPALRAPGASRPHSARRRSPWTVGREHGRSARMWCHTVAGSPQPACRMTCVFAGILPVHALLGAASYAQFCCSLLGSPLVRGAPGHAQSRGDRV